MPRRPLVSLLCVLLLAGCADPPGLRKPLPVDYQEQNKAQEAYRRLGPQLAKYDVVVGSYLTQTNNPRRIVVVVRDKAAREQMRMLFGKEVDGVKIKYEIATKGFDVDEGITEVPRQDLPQTWWDKVVYYFKHFAYRVLPSDVIDRDDEPAPKLPPPDAAPKDPSLKST